MNSARRCKMALLLFIVFILALVTGLVLYALRQNINLFYSPTQIAAGEVDQQRMVRLGGMVVAGSIVRDSGDLSVSFQLTDYEKTITVFYKGILPDLFREGQGIVALGVVKNNKQFVAKEVLAKHDANYMPAEVKAALKGRANEGSIAK